MTDIREKCIELGRDAMGRNNGWRWWHPRHLEKLFDLWEPIIRADERERIVAEYPEWPEGVPAPGDTTEYLLYLIARVRAYEREQAEAERDQRDPGFIGTAMKLMADERADLRAKIDTMPHGDWVDPNGRPRPCPKEWPGGPCNCWHAEVLALLEVVND